MTNKNQNPIDHQKQINILLIGVHAIALKVSLERSIAVGAGTRVAAAPLRAGAGLLSPSHISHCVVSSLFKSLLSVFPCSLAIHFFAPFLCYRAMFTFNFLPTRVGEHQIVLFFVDTSGFLRGFPARSSTWTPPLHPSRERTSACSDALMPLGQNQYLSSSLSFTE